MPGYKVSGKNSKGSSVTRKYWAKDEEEALELASQEGIVKATAKFMPATDAQLENIKKYGLQAPDNCCQHTASDIIQRSLDGSELASPQLRKFAFAKGWRGSTYIGENGILHELDSIASPEDAAYIFVAAVDAYASNRKLAVSSLLEKDKKLDKIASTLAKDDKYLSSILKQYPISDCLRFSFAETSDGGRQLSKQTKVYIAARQTIAPTDRIKTASSGTTRTTQTEYKAPRTSVPRKAEPSGCAWIIAVVLLAPTVLVICCFFLVRPFTFA